ncbi:MAG: VOC family protein [Enterococcus sp.]
MNEFNLGNDTCLNSIAIRVKDRDKMIDFYQKIIGFDLKREENELAILGTIATDSELLLLEESPRANDHTGEIKKLQRLTLVIPTKEEFANILYRIRTANYTIKDALTTQGRMGLIVTDPEENELEIYFSDQTTTGMEQPKQLNQEEVVAQASRENQTLSEDVHFEKVHLNVHSLASEHTFLSEILGLKVQDELDGIHVLNEGAFHVGLNEAQGGTIALPTDEVLGLDFLRFGIKKDRLQSLEEHLLQADYDFFIDKKKTVLTIYDSIGIEWWFMSK